MHSRSIPGPIFYMKPRAITLVVLCLVVGVGVFFWWRQSPDDQNKPADEEAEILVQDEIAQQPTLDDELTALLETSDMSDPAVRAQIVEQVRAREEAIREATHAKAKRLGIPIREVYPDGTIIEIQGFEGDRPIYNSTQNKNAAISSGANQIRKQAPPFDLSGSGVIVGVWDGGVALESHRELKSADLKIMDAGARVENHPTHVVGTIVAQGEDAKAQGMAPSSQVLSYDWNSDISEMLMNGASAAGGINRVSISNHSYAIDRGGYNAHYYDYNKHWTWYGQKVGSPVDNSGKIVDYSGKIDEKLGRYDSRANAIDTVAYSLPYLSIFFCAMNDRDDYPKQGDSVAQYGGNSFIYDAATSPLPDGIYRNAGDKNNAGEENKGYETILSKNLGKNVITVGAIDDAVADESGNRSLAPTDAKMSTFSSWGPTDDGRIKPDVVANGVEVYSSLAKDSEGGIYNDLYANYWGTSMATPSAAGSAALLAEFYRKNFPTQSSPNERLMPSSLMKALLIHTADDLGTPGPDYSYGWGLINVKEAADIILAHKKDALGNPKLIEGAIIADKRPLTYNFQSDGRTPIRVTLCWTDPTGPVQSESDSRTSVLSHNLDLLITGPNGEVHQPYKMPYVGDWSVAKMSAPATRGKNDTDNVEQVYDRAKPTLNGAGLYKVTVSLDGSLKKGITKQNFSLVVTGGKALPPGRGAIDLDYSLRFDKVAVGEAKTMNLQIRNVGRGDLKVTGIDLFGNREISGNYSGVIKAGATEVVAITYAPAVYVPSRGWFGTLRVLSDSIPGRSTVPLGRSLAGIPGYQIPQSDVAVKTNHIDNLVGSEWSYDQEGESFTNRFAFNADWTVRIIVVDNPNYWSGDIRAGRRWRPLGPNQISIDANRGFLNLKFTSEDTFEATSMSGKKIVGRRYDAPKTTAEDYTKGLAGRSFFYHYYQSIADQRVKRFKMVDSSIPRFEKDGTIWTGYEGSEDRHGLWDGVTWKAHSKNVVRLSNAITGKEIYFHFISPRWYTDGSKPDYRSYVSVGWEGANISATFDQKIDLKVNEIDLTKRQEGQITGYFGGINMEWRLPDQDADESRGHWRAFSKTPRKQWKDLMNLDMPAAPTRADAQAWIKKMNEMHPQPAGRTWATLPSLNDTPFKQGFHAIIVAE